MAYELTCSDWVLVGAEIKTVNKPTSRTHGRKYVVADFRLANANLAISGNALKTMRFFQPDQDASVAVWLAAWEAYIQEPETLVIKAGIASREVGPHVKKYVSDRDGHKAGDYITHTDAKGKKQVSTFDRISVFVTCTDEGEAIGDVDGLISRIYNRDCESKEVFQQKLAKKHSANSSKPAAPVTLGTPVSDDAAADLDDDADPFA